MFADSLWVYPSKSRYGILIPYVDILDLPVYYALHPTCPVQNVPMRLIVPTQPRLDIRTLNKYRRRTRMTDGDGQLPLGICFNDSDAVYLMDGHHRWYVCQERGRGILRMRVAAHDISLQQALNEGLNRILVTPKLPAFTTSTTGYTATRLPF